METLFSFLDISLVTANKFYTYGWIASCSGALITLIGVILLMWGTRVRDTHFELNIASLHDRAASSEERSKELEKGNLLLQHEVEREKTERLKLEERVKPRSLSDAQEKIISEMLVSAPRGPVFVVPKWLDPEAEFFGKQIEGLLKNLGFSIIQMTGDNKPLSYEKLGTFLVIRDKNNQPPHLKPIYEAFRAAGIELVVYDDQYVPDAGSVFIGVSVKP